MSEITLFKVANGKAIKLSATEWDLEKPLQNLIENNLEPLLRIQFLATEYATGKTHGGRIDSLGIDENHCPVIIEYKRSIGENVMSQGLYYLNWLLDHKAEFKLLVLEQCGKEEAEKIDWNAPRVICIAADFTRYDIHAAQEMAKSIELFRYRRFGQDLLFLEFLNPGSQAVKAAKAPKAKALKSSEATAADWVSEYSAEMRDLFSTLVNHLLSLGDDVERKDLKLYIAFKRIKNFATVEPRKDLMRAFVHLDPSKVAPVKGFSRDVSKIGHWGTGDLEITMRSLQDLEKAKPFLRLAYLGESSLV